MFVVEHEGSGPSELDGPSRQKWSSDVYDFGLALSSGPKDAGVLDTNLRRWRQSPPLPGRPVDDRSWAQRRSFSSDPGMPTLSVGTSGVLTPLRENSCLSGDSIGVRDALVDESCGWLGRASVHSPGSCFVLSFRAPNGLSPTTAAGVSPGPSGNGGFSILEVVIALTILLTVLVSVSSLMVTESKWGRTHAFEKWPPRSPPAPGQRVQTGASALLGKVGDSTLANVTSAGQTYVGELEVSP